VNLNHNFANPTNPKTLWVYYGPYQGLEAQLQK